MKINFEERNGKVKSMCVCVQVSREERERKRIVKEMGKTERKMEKRGRE